MRTTEEVINSHLKHFANQEVEQDLAENYSPEVNVDWPNRSCHGLEGVRECLFELQEYLPKATHFFEPRLIGKNRAAVSWKAESPVGQIRNGVIYFTLRDGRIVRESLHFTIEPVVSNQG